MSVKFVIGVFTGMVLNSLIQVNMILILIVDTKVDTERSWVCCTCEKYLKKKQIPGQAVINKF